MNAREEIFARLARIEAHPIVEPSLLARSVVLDLTKNNPSLRSADISDPAAFQSIIDRARFDAGALCAIGRYDEDRIIYRHASLFRLGAEARSIHLGIDLFVPAGTRLTVPLDGSIHSFADNARSGDYGPTIILEHCIDDLVFHSLYGHLNRDCLNPLRRGQRVHAGDRLGAVGEAKENGGWPPHVHIQLITNLGDRTGDFPGVASHRDREAMLHACPNPSPLIPLP